MERDASQCPDGPLAALERHCTEVPRTAGGVYLLIDGNEVVYVGQSDNVYARIGWHASNVSPRDGYPLPADFERALFIRTAAKDRDAYEGALIRSLRPRFNRNAPAPTRHEIAILDRLGLPRHDPKKARKAILENRAKHRAIRKRRERALSRSLFDEHAYDYAARLEAGGVRR